MQEQPQTRLSSFHCLIIGAFLCYLAFFQQELDGNSIFMGLLGIACFIVSFCKSKRFHRYLLKSIGVLEIDLDALPKESDHEHHL